MSTRAWRLPVTVVVAAMIALPVRAETESIRPSLPATPSATGHPCGATRPDSCVRVVMAESAEGAETPLGKILGVDVAVRKIGDGEYELVISVRDESASNGGRTEWSASSGYLPRSRVWSPTTPLGCRLFHLNRSASGVFELLVESYGPPTRSAGP